MCNSSAILHELNMAKVHIDDHRLIASVQGNPALYDRTSPNYKDPVHKDNAWTSIAIALNLPKVVCKSRWTIIRQRYSRVRRQLSLPSKTYIEGGRKTSWRLYDSLGFLNHHILPRNRKKCRRRDALEIKLEEDEERGAGPKQPRIFVFERPPPAKREEKGAGDEPARKEEEDVKSGAFGARGGDHSFGEYIACELASFRNDVYKDMAKQSIVNVIYKYKNQVYEQQN